MIKIEVSTNPDGFMNIKAQGHADPRICASVSTLLQSSVRYLQELEQHFPEELEINIKAVKE